MVRRHALPAFLVAVGASSLVVLARAGEVGQGVAWLVVLAVVALLVSPWVFPRPLDAAEALARSRDDGRPVVFWRPGCQFCLRLRIALGAAGRRVHWVDIWRDPEGAAQVRAITGGDETVPTVVLGDQSRVNPEPSWVRGLIP